MLQLHRELAEIWVLHRPESTCGMVVHRLGCHLDALIDALVMQLLKDSGMTASIGINNLAAAALRPALTRLLGVMVAGVRPTPQQDDAGSWVAGRGQAYAKRPRGMPQTFTAAARRCLLKMLSRCATGRDEAACVQTALETKVSF